MVFTAQEDGEAQAGLDSNQKNKAQATRYRCWVYSPFSNLPDCNLWSKWSVLRSDSATKAVPDVSTISSGPGVFNGSRILHCSSGRVLRHQPMAAASITKGEVRP